MERDLKALTTNRFDVVVLGGGVLGACVARDAASRGLSVALLERHDFASGTSCNSLKIVHGGLRHLQHLDLAGMRTSVRERATWLRIAPHLVEPLPVVVPLFGGVAERAAYRAALGVNDALSFDRNRGLPPERQIADGRTLGRSEVLERIPELESTRVSGGVLFHDGLMYSSERLVLSVVLAAVQAGAIVANHVECTGPLLEDNRRVGVRVGDALGGGEIAVRARIIVNAAGPTGPALTARLLNASLPRPAPLTLAWNLMIDGLGHEVAFALPGVSSTPTGTGGVGPRRLFVVPWRGRTLIGTGHAAFDGDPESFEAMTAEHPALRSFLDELNGSWPRSPIVPEDAVLIHSGLLPAASSNQTSAGDVRLARHPSVATTAEGGAPIVTATTVKFTTSRQVAQDAVDRACRILGHGVPSQTARQPLPGAPERGLPRLLEEAHRELAAELEEDVIEHLVRSHGTGYRDVLRCGSEDGRWRQRVSPDSPVIFAQLVHAARHEMARTPDDVLRRTELNARALVDADVRALAQKALAHAPQSRRKLPS